MIRIILIRHGRTAWNAADGQGSRFRGTIDLPLTDDGQAQARATARRLADLPLAAIYSSPLQPAVLTAQNIAQPHGLQIQAVPGLASMDYGHWAGKSYAAVSTRWPELYHRWCRNPFQVQIPGGACLSHLADRAVATTHKILADHKEGDTVVLVSHQAVTNALICSLMGLPATAYWLIHQDLCNLSHLDYDPIAATFTLAGFNDICHLDGTLPHILRGGTRIILIRHGQTAWNLGAGEERFRGRTDLTLDDVGRAQAVAVARRLRAEAIEAVYTSSLLRTQQTAEPLADGSSLVELGLRCHAGLLDIDYGGFQGLTHSQAATSYPELYGLWRNAPGQVLFPGGEGLVDVQKRTSALLEELSARHPRQTVALVGHQIVNKVIVCTLLGLGLDRIWRVQQDTCGLSVFQQVDGKWHTLGLNDTCHL
jgi:probable phosphoglycerate mutase